MNQIIIMDDGTLVDYKTAVSQDLIKNLSISEHVSLKEIWETTDLSFYYANKTLILFEKLRTALGNKGLSITSGYRSATHQKNLVAYYASIGQDGLAADHSPHSEGMAMDVAFPDRASVMKAVKALRKIRDTEMPYIRIGFQEYLDSGYTFVHMDTCPYFYATDSGLFKNDTVSRISGNPISDVWRAYNGEW